jgi:RHS repeat-associated protein
MKAFNLGRNRAALTFSLILTAGFGSFAGTPCTITISPSAPAPACPGYTITLTASGGSSYQWIAQAPATMDFPTNRASISPSMTGYYQVSGMTACGRIDSDWVYVEYLTSLLSGSISGPSSVCPGASAALTNVTSPSGSKGTYTYQWQSRPVGGTWANISGATSMTYTAPSVTVATEFRRMAATTCGDNSYTSGFTVNLYSGTSAGVAGSSTTVCSGSSATLSNITSATGGNGTYNYQWQWSYDNLNWNNVSGATSSSYTTAALTGPLWYRRTVTSCGTVAASSVQVTVYPAVSAGSIGPSQVICPNGSPTRITSYSNASGGNGGYSYQWQSSTDNSTWTNISGATLSYYDPPMNAGTYYYRRAVTSCSQTAYTSSVYVTLQQDPTSGSIGYDQLICSGSTPALFQNVTSPQYGDNTYAYQWQKSVDNVTWTDISGATLSTYQSPALTQKTYFARKVSSCGYTRTTSMVTVDVYAAPVAATPTISGGATTRCKGSGTTTLSTSSGAADYYQWTINPSTAGTFSGTTASVTLTWADNFSSQSLVASITVQAFKCSAGGPVSSAVNITTYQTPVVTGPSSLTISSGDNVQWTPNYASGIGTTYSYTSSYGGSLSVEKSSGSGTITYAGQNIFSNNLPLTPTNFISITGGNAGTVTYSVTGNYNGCSVPFSLPVLVNPKPIIRLNASYSKPVIALGSKVRIEADYAYSQYQWKKDGIDIAGATSSYYDVTEPGQYSLSAKGVGGSAFVLSNNFQVFAIGYETDATTNMRVTTMIRKAGITPSTNLYQSLQKGEYLQSVDYSDGLDRTTEVVAIGASPLEGDLIAISGFDTLKTTDYSPYTDPSRTGYLRTTGSAIPSQLSFYGSHQKIAYSTTPYAITLFEKSPLRRVSERGAPGESWQPGLHTTKEVLLTNDASNVKKWTANGPSGTYNANELTVSNSIDENGNNVYSFIDKNGLTVLKRVQLDDNLVLNGTSFTVPYLETYYFYDTRGNIKYQIPPKANAMLDIGTAWSTAFRDQWCYVYNYDTKGRVIEAKTPNAVWVYNVYDPIGRLVLTQDGNLRASNKWNFIKYDIKGRAVITGVYTNTTNTTRSSMDSLVVRLLYPGANDVYWEEKGTAAHGYTNISFPTTNSTVLSVNYYDEYDFDGNGSADYSYTSQGLSNESTQGTAFGRPTGTKKQIVGTPDWLYNYVFYDTFGRIVQTRSNNHLDPTSIDNLTTIVYDFEGKPVTSKSYHHTAAGANQTTVMQRGVYDFAGRATEVYESINGGAEQQLAKYSYNEIGQITEKNLHKKSDNSFIQSIDYRYNIRGWLSSINNASLAVDANNNDNDWYTDLFGMQLAYDSAKGYGNTPGYNGSITGVKWKGAGMAASSAGVKSYKMSYDKTYRLKTATFQKYNGAWTAEANAWNESQTYDHNGNILTLTRNQLKRTLQSNFTIATSPETIDNLTYSYLSTQADQLLKVEDSGTAQGFNNGANTTTEYAFDGDGRQLSDSNKGIASITYNDFGKPSVVTYTGSPVKTTTYSYDGSGTRLKSVVYDGTATITTDYVGDFVYENNAMAFFSSPEGRVVKNGASFEYQYAILDHLGNTRVIFSSVDVPASTSVADYENSVNADFVNYPATVSDGRSSTNNHTLPSGSYSELLNGYYISDTNQGQVGTGKTLRVFPGDVIHAEVYAKYLNQTGTSTNFAPFANVLVASFGLTGATGGEGLLAKNALGNYGGAVVAAGGSGSTSTPKAFITILLFDQNYNFLDVSYQQVGATANTYELLSRDYTVREPGYAYIYLSNENQTLVDVYFDDLKIINTKSNVIQYTEYYPFGATTSDSWTRDNVRGNNYLANGGTERNALTGLYDLQFRTLDPLLGRMTQVDPMASKYSGMTPYNFALNTPMGLVDPTGLEPRWGLYTRDEWNASGGYDRPYDARDEDPRRSTDSPMTNSLYGGGGSTAGSYSTTDSNVIAAILLGFIKDDLFFGENGFLGIPEYAIRSEEGNLVRLYVSKTNWIDLNGPPQQGGVVLNFTEKYNNAYATGKGWTVLNGTDLASGLSALQAYAASGKTITNLVIHSHGTPDGSQIHLGSSNLDYKFYGWRKLNPMVALMNQVLALVSPGGTVVFTGCNAANLLGPAMSTNIRCDINAYMNTNYTYGPYGGASGNSFWFGTNRIGGPNPNWMNLQSGASGHVISIGLGGIKVK